MIGIKDFIKRGWANVDAAIIVSLRITIFVYFKAMRA